MVILYFIFFVVLTCDAVNRIPTRLKLDSPKNLALCRENCYIKITNHVKIWCKTYGSENDCRQVILYDLQQRENKLPTPHSVLVLEREKVPYTPSRQPAKNILL